MLSKLLQVLGRQPTLNPSVEAEKKPVDSAVDPLLEQFDGLLTRGVPDAYRIWQAAQAYAARGDARSAIKCQNLNYLLHNSAIPNSVRLGEGVRFGYGGIGLVIHAQSEIGKGAHIGANVTLGGHSGGKRRLNTEGKPVGVPKIGDYAYLATGSKILGGVEIGTLSIVGANSIVTKDVPPLAIVAGAPARQVGRITAENCLRYKSTFISLRDRSNSDFKEMIIQLDSQSTQLNPI